MSYNTINTTYWKQSTGLTGQCKTERTAALFNRVAGLYKVAHGLNLSKMQMYRQAHAEATLLKAETNGRIMDTASAIMGIQLKELEKELRQQIREKTFTAEVEFDTMKVTNIRDLAQSKRGKKVAA